jgi:hypothetical protein
MFRDRPLENRIHDLLGDLVGDAEEDPSDHDETQYDTGRLRHLATVRPLDALQLSPAATQEVEDAIAVLGARANGLLVGKGRLAEGDIHRLLRKRFKLGKHGAPGWLAVARPLERLLVNTRILG